MVITTKADWMVDQHALNYLADNDDVTAVGACG